MRPRLCVKLGETWPRLAVRVAAPEGQVWPEPADAVATGYSRAPGTAWPITEHAGSADITVSEGVLQCLFAPDLPYSSVETELDFDISIEFESGEIVRIPGNVGGIPRFARVSIVDDIGDEAITPTPPAYDDGSGVLGIWIGVSP